jgi:hypothetical protein
MAGSSIGKNSILEWESISKIIKLNKAYFKLLIINNLNIVYLILNFSYFSSIFI